MSVAAIERSIVTDRTRRTYAGSDGVKFMDRQAYVKVDAEGTPRYQ